MKFFSLTIFGCFTDFFSCVDDELQVEYYKIKVDSVSDSIDVTDTLKIHLYGTIGDNGCYSFEKYEQSASNHNLTLTVWG